VDKWLEAALEYIPSWIEFQMRQSEQAGCVVAIVHHGRVVLEKAFGLADLKSGEALTPRHRFRVASQSKTFTAAGVMRLREQGRLKLDDAIGLYIKGLHPQIAQATVAQVLSHSAGLARDGFTHQQPSLSAEDILADLTAPPVIEPNTRFKYSNHGYALIGLLIESITAEAYRSWIKREIVDSFELEETEPDMPLPEGTPFARGHSCKLPFGRRVVLHDFPTLAIAPAGGFIATAADLARFFGQLSPGAARSALSVESRREMIRRQWGNPHSTAETYYGLGTMSGSIGAWDWFGHAGELQGYTSRSCVVLEQELAVSLLINGSDGWAGPWVDGIIHILRVFAYRGAPSQRVQGWTGRWWTVRGALDLVPAGDLVLVATPLLWNPFMDATEIEIVDMDRGRIVLADGYGSLGEEVRRIRESDGPVGELWIAAGRWVPEAQLATEESVRKWHRAAMN
jgi:CubicO group peptidase (beta-lactamase class C family)